MKKILFIISLLLPLSLAAQGYTDFERDTLQLENVEVSAQNGARVKMNRVTNTELIGTEQLVRAACCNLGESFTTNPSVDVSYSDAATGAKQIKLLGLSGTYVQMLTENVPNLRGAAIPFSLGYIPGPWMSAIQVSKGASSVKNGYESITGQINIEYLKPQGVDGVRGNLYFDTDQKLEANVDGSIHITDKLSTSLLLHYEDRQKTMDMNHDSFVDMPKLGQYDVMNRWAYVSPRFISQLFVKALNEHRESGQLGPYTYGGKVPFEIFIDADRYELQWKNAIITNPDKNASVALMIHGSYHDEVSDFELKHCAINHKNGYAQLMYETDINDQHNLSVGASLNHDYFYTKYFNARDFHGPSPGFHDPLSPSYSDNKEYIHTELQKETTGGAYAQYTYKLEDKLTVMAGVRYDYSNLHKGFFTPRLHIHYSPTEWFSLRASAGKGYRTSHPLAENVTLLASNRILRFRNRMKQEEACNYGTSLSFNIPLFDKNLELNAEYYYTDFKHQTVINYTDSITQRGTVYPFLVFENLEGKSYSHTVQVDATYPFFRGFSATAAWRFNDARTTYDGELRRRPLTSKYKGLLTLSYKTPLEMWQFDVTGQLIGPGETYLREKYPSYGLLQAQITREFRHFSIYIGGENLTGYKQKNPIISADDPRSDSFDATQIWAPTTGAMGYIGIRFNFEKD